MRKRTIYIVDKLQLKYILSFIGVIVLAGGLTNWYFLHMLKNAYFFTKNPTRLIWSFYWVFLSGYLIIFLVLIYFIILISNRTFGPLYRIEQDLKKFLSGDKTMRIKLRKKDDLKHLADNINKALDLAGK